MIIRFWMNLGVLPNSFGLLENNLSATDPPSFLTSGWQAFADVYPCDMQVSKGGCQRSFKNESFSVVKTEPLSSTFFSDPAISLVVFSNNR